MRLPGATDRAITYLRFPGSYIFIWRVVRRSCPARPPVASRPAIRAHRIRRAPHVLLTVTTTTAASPVSPSSSPRRNRVIPRAGQQVRRMRRREGGGGGGEPAADALDWDLDINLELELRDDQQSRLYRYLSEGHRPRYRNEPPRRAATVQALGNRSVGVEYGVVRVIDVVTRKNRKQNQNFNSLK